MAPAPGDIVRVDGIRGTYKVHHVRERCGSVIVIEPKSGGFYAYKPDRIRQLDGRKDARMATANWTSARERAREKRGKK